MTEEAPLSSTHLSEDRLESWKEIARYLKRDESTVQRWEKREGMPVHRHLHDKRGSVYAFPLELDAWWQNRRQYLEQKRPAEPQNPELQDSATATDASVTPARQPRRARWIMPAAALSLIAASLLAWQWLTASSTPATSPNPALIRLTSTSGLNIDPALSPDGSLLAYASDRAGSADLDIWVQPTTAETPTRITSAPGDETEPSYSPDGASIVFSKAETGGIYVVGSVGGEPRLLVPAARARTPRFSPDGRWVAYWTGLPAFAIPVFPTAAMFVVPAGGGPPRRLAADFANARSGVWSPDGASLLFLGERDHDADGSSLDWYVVSVEGGTPVQTGALKVLRAAGIAGAPLPGAWNAGGDVIFSTLDEGSSNVWLLPVSPATARVTGNPLQLTLGTANARTPAIASSSGVAFASVVENVDVWRLPLETAADGSNGGIERITDSAGADRLMNMSRDGRAMAFISSRTGRAEAWVKDVETGRERQITHAGATLARLSPDAVTMAVASTGSGSAVTSLVPVAGGPETRLCDDCRPADWSADGSRLLILRGSPARLVIRELASGREIELAAHPAWNLFQARMSPDDKWVVFHTTNSASLRQIYAVPVGNGPVPVDAWVPIVTDFGVQPAWTADGAGIYHFSIRDGVICAWLQPLDPATKRPVGAPRAVHHLHQPRLRAGAGAAITNDVAAGYLYMTLTESGSNIWMLRR